MTTNKTQTLAGELRGKILADEFSSGRLPTERELAGMFRVGRCTVRAALAILEQEGRIERRRKSGTLIRKNLSQKDRGLAGLIFRAAGHLYGDLYHHFLTHFSNAGYSVQCVSTGNLYPGVRTEKKRLPIARAIQKMLAADPSALVVDGYMNNGIPYIEEIKKRSPIFIDFFDSSKKRFSTGVWFDYRKAGYLAGKYLVESGCRRPLLFSNYVPPGVKLNPAAYSVHKEKLIVDGFRAAMTEGGIDPETAVAGFLLPSASVRQGILYNIISSPLCMPDGFCGASDCLVVEFLKILLEIRGRIPDELRVTGIGNTPWSGEESFIPFTSVDLNLENVAAAVTAQAMLPPEKRKDIWIEPKLIVRERKEK